MKILITKIKPIFLSLSIILLIVFWISSNMNWGKQRWHKLLRIDGVGYYAYLPAIFIYEDLSFEFFKKIQESENRPQLDAYFINKTSDGATNKYFVGTAICEMPFFLMAHITTKTLSETADGYSFYYMLSIQFAAIFYLIIGLIILSEILKFYHISTHVRAITLIAIFFGTNLLHYVVHEPFMSHIYSFAFVNLFVWAILNYLKNHNTKWLIISAISLGLIFLIRPVNLLIFFAIPFLVGDIKILKEEVIRLIKNPFALLVSALIFLSISSIQFLIYKIQTGHFFVYTYGSETLDLTQPHIFDFLFSYRKGFFLWAPLTFFSLIGLIQIARKKMFQLIAWISFLFIVVYVLSSWWVWYYGGSFGSRVMIEYLTFFAIPLALFTEATKAKKFIISIILSLCLFTQIQSFQYVYGYIHWSDMNKEWYWDNFLRVDKVIKGDKMPWDNN